MKKEKDTHLGIQNDTDYDVIIIGGGTSGLTAAQELAEKNLKVCVLEANSFIGGKPISAFCYPLKPPLKEASAEEKQKYLSSPPEENREVENQLPVEHGFRVYPENYNNLLSIMRRIPTTPGQDVSHYLTNSINIAEYLSVGEKNTAWKDIFLSKLEKIFFGIALYTPYILCTERSLKYDDVSINDLFAAPKRSPELQNFIMRLIDSLSSGMLNKVSSLAVINILMNYYYAPGRTGFRTFDRPTHLAWLKPWEEYLEKTLKVTIHKNTKVVQVNLNKTKETIIGADVKLNEVVAIHHGEKKTFKGKYFLFAMPVDALVNLIAHNNEMLRYDVRLFDLQKITTLPATGVQLFYETPLKGTEKKLYVGSAIDHPWGISYVEQSSYWANSKEYLGPYGCISIYVSVTTLEGRFINKTLQKCTSNEIAYEMFTEVEEEFAKRNIPIPKRIGYYAHSYQQESYDKQDKSNPVLNDHYDGTYHQDQLHLCITGMYRWRPPSETIYLTNMLVCGAYTKNKTYYVSTMESACESGRRAANAILNQLGMPNITIYEMNVPRSVRALRQFDKFLYTLWLPNPFDLILKLMRRCLDTSKVHMDNSIREYENLHW